MAKETYYFQHDYNARNDMKIQALIHDFKSSGYGVYWCIVEIMHEEDNHHLPLKQMTYLAVAKQMNEEASLIEEIVCRCINDYELFTEKNGFFYSERVLDNIYKRAETSARRSFAGKAGAIAKQKLANAKQTQASVKQSLASVKQNQAKEIKEKEIKDINISFECFWNLYDKKVGSKEKLEKKWGNLTDEERDLAISHIEKYKTAKPDKRYRKDPETYLNNKSFNDEIISDNPNETPLDNSKNWSNEQYEDYVRGHLKTAS